MPNWNADFVNVQIDSDFVHANSAFVKRIYLHRLHQLERTFSILFLLLQFVMQHIVRLFSLSSMRKILVKRKRARDDEMIMWCDWFNLNRSTNNWLFCVRQHRENTLNLQLSKPKSRFCCCKEYDIFTGKTHRNSKNYSRIFSFSE